MGSQAHNQLIQDFANWLEHSAGRSTQTVNNYCRWLRALGAYLNDNDMDYLTANRRMLEGFSGLEAHKRGVQPESRRPIVSAIRKFYGWLEENRVIAENPAQYLAYPKIGKALPTLISREAVEDLLRDCDLSTLQGARDAAMMAILAAAGLRISGLINLNLSNIYRETLADKTQRLMVRVLEKGKDERVVMLHDIAGMYVYSYLAHPDMQQLKESGALLLPDGDQVLFVATRRGSTPLADWHSENRRVSASSFRKMLRARGKRCNIPTDQLHPHAFRHLFGTELYDNDVPIADIKAIMGHSNIAYTEIYIRLAGSRQARYLEAHSPIASMDTVMLELHKQIQHAPAQLPAG